MSCPRTHRALAGDEAEPYQVLGSVEQPEAVRIGVRFDLLVESIQAAVQDVRHFFEERQVEVVELAKMHVDVGGGA